MHGLQKEYERKRELSLKDCGEYGEYSYELQRAYVSDFHTDNLQGKCDIATCILPLFPYTYINYGDVYLWRTFTTPQGVTKICEGVLAIEDCADLQNVLNNVRREFVRRCLEYTRKHAVAKKFITHGEWCGENTPVDPYSFFLWAKSKGYTLPPEVGVWLVENEPVQHEQALAAALVPAPKEQAQAIPDNPKEYGHLLIQKGYEPSKRIAMLKSQFPKLKTYELGAYARGYIPDENNKEACKKWYQKNK